MADDQVGMTSGGNPYLDRPLPKNRSWWRRFSRHVPADRHELVRCLQCNRLLWLDGKEIHSEAHLGHKFMQTTHGTWWDFLRLKLGLIR